MGFEESAVLEALRITNNNQESACEWLLGDRRHDSGGDALEDGVEPSSPLYQAIISNPVVQLGLSNPRCLLGEHTSTIVTASRLNRMSLLVGGLSADEISFYSPQTERQYVNPHALMIYAWPTDQLKYFIADMRNTDCMRMISYQYLNLVS